MDDFGRMAPQQEESAPSITVAEGHAFEEEQVGRWRGSTSADLPLRWQGAAFLLQANVTQQVSHVRQASLPNRHISSYSGGANNTGSQPLPAGAALVIDGAAAAFPQEATAVIPAHDAAGSSSRGSADEVGLREASLSELPSLDDFPSELISMIGAYLPDQDVGNLSRASRRLREVFAQENQTGRLVRQARRATELVEFQALLGEPDRGSAGVRGLRMTLQERPLVALIDRIRILPSTDRLTIFKLIHDTATAVTFPTKHCTALLAGLAARIPNLPEPDQRNAYQRILSAVAGLARKNRSAVLEVLATTIFFLPEHGRRSAFDATQSAIAELDLPDRGAPLDALALSLPLTSAPS